MSDSKLSDRVTPEQKAESDALLVLWNEKRPHHPDCRRLMTQGEFGKEFGIGKQGAVSNCINGLMPISLKAARGFAKGLGISIADFSPRLAEIGDMVALYAREAWPFSFDRALLDLLNDKGLGYVEGQIASAIDFCAQKGWVKDAESGVSTNETITDSPKNAPKQTRAQGVTRATDLKIEKGTSDGAGVSLPKNEGSSTGKPKKGS